MGSGTLLPAGGSYMNRLALVLLGALATAGPLVAQHQDPATRQHQGMIMGFDQEATAHHFYLYEDGGAIDVSVRDKADATNLAAIRRHLEMLPAHFKAGDFSTPQAVHAGTTVAGADDLARLKDKLDYRYEQTDGGGRVEIVSADAEAVAAVHAFLRFQIADHATGDSTAVTKRK
jgi:hypothetical protein